MAGALVLYTVHVNCNAKRIILCVLIKSLIALITAKVSFTLNILHLQALGKHAVKV